jgi:uncharacterized membrane protein YGL010W
MLMKSKKHSDSENFDCLSAQELKSDFNKGLLITVLCFVLTYITYKLGDCHKEALFCTKLSLVSTGIIGLFYLKAKKD